MSSSKRGPSMTNEINQQQNVNMPSFDALLLENPNSVRKPSDVYNTSDDNEFKTFYFHSSNAIAVYKIPLPHKMQKNNAFLHNCGRAGILCRQI